MYFSISYSGIRKVDVSRLVACYKYGACSKAGSQVTAFGRITGQMEVHYFKIIDVHVCQARSISCIMILTRGYCVHGPVTQTCLASKVLSTCEERLWLCNKCAERQRRSSWNLSNLTKMDRKCTLPHPGCDLFSRLTPDVLSQGSLSHHSRGGWHFSAPSPFKTKARLSRTARQHQCNKQNKRNNVRRA